MSTLPIRPLAEYGPFTFTLLINEPYRTGTPVGRPSLAEVHVNPALL